MRAVMAMFGVLVAANLACNTKNDASPGASGSASTSSSASPPPKAEGTHGKAADVLAAYLSKETCQERAPFLLHPERNLSLMLADRKDSTKCRLDYTKIEEVRGNDTISEMNVKIAGSNDLFYVLRKIGSEWKIDWKCSVAYSPMSLAEFKATQPAKPSLFRMLATLDDYYNFDFANAKKTHFSVNLRTPTGEGDIHGYLAKSAKDAQQLLATLKDGKEHHIIVELRYPPNANSSNAEITRFVTEYWMETDAGE